MTRDTLYEQLITELYPSKNLYQSCKLCAKDLGCCVGKIYMPTTKSTYSIRYEVLQYLKLKKKFLMAQKRFEDLLVDMREQLEEISTFGIRGDASVSVSRLLGKVAGADIEEMSKATEYCATNDTEEAINIGLMYRL